MQDLAVNPVDALIREIRERPAKERALRDAQISALNEIAKAKSLAFVPCYLTVS